MRVPSLGQEDPLEEEMAAHSSILAWIIPRTEQPGAGGVGLNPAVLGTGVEGTLMNQTSTLFPQTTQCSGEDRIRNN